ncbi:MAG: efflux RND transporter periplasmic adaptor subunit [Sphingobacteriales bacterium]|nr:MAG: efflux RND transporter periplasmic adaptor subunit [Sphingobacteriales bacterium]
MDRIYRKAALLISSVAVLCSLQSCGSGEAKKETKAEAPAATEAFKLQRSALSSTVKIPGELVAYQQVDIYAKVSSFVKKLYADVGTEVKEGQLLAEMEAPEMGAQLSAATSRLKSQEATFLASKATYDRLLETSKTPGTVSQNDLDLANARQKSDMAQLEAARASQREVTDTRNYLQIRAPFSGIITSRNVSAGAYVGPSGKGSELPIFTLQEQKHLRLVVSVPDAYVSNLSHQNEVEFTVRSQPNEKFKAKVTRLAGALDNKLRSQRTEMDVINEDKRLLPGMVAEVSLNLNGSDNVFVVPSSALLSSTEGMFIIRVKDNKAEWVPVSTGRSGDDKTEVFGELNDNDVIVTHASEEIRRDAPVGNVSIK